MQQVLGQMKFSGNNIHTGNYRQFYKVQVIANCIRVGLRLTFAMHRGMVTVKTVLSKCRLDYKASSNFHKHKKHIFVWSQMPSDAIFTSSGCDD